MSTPGFSIFSFYHAYDGYIVYCLSYIEKHFAVNKHVRMRVEFWFPDFHIMVIGVLISRVGYTTIDFPSSSTSLSYGTRLIYCIYIYALAVVINRYTYKLERLLKIRAAYAHSSMM